MVRLDVRTSSWKAVWGRALLITSPLFAGFDEKLRNLTGPTPNSSVHLTDGQMLVIKRWIQLGAQND